MEIRLEDIIFWIVIILIISLAIWLLIGSPTDTSSIIALATFVAMSGILLWKYLFNIDKNIAVNIEKLDKKTAISFERVKNQLNNIEKMLNRLNR